MLIKLQLVSVRTLYQIHKISILEKLIRLLLDFCLEFYNFLKIIFDRLFTLTN